MEHNKKKINAWLEQATKGIRFTLDRCMVRKELQEHFEDKVLDIQRIFPNMSEDEVLERALNQMGDAEKIGMELARIHKPWLGYLWKASQILLSLLFLYFGYCFLGYELDLWPEYHRTSFYSEGVEVFMREKRYDLPDDAQPLKLDLPEPVKVENYTISMIQADLWGPSIDQNWQKYRRDLYLIFEVEYSHLWETPMQFADRLWAIDDCGNRIMNQIENWDDTIPYGPHTKCISMLYKGPRKCRYEITIPVNDWNAKRMDVRYTHLGVDMMFSLDLTGGAL